MKAPVIIIAAAIAASGMIGTTPAVAFHLSPTGSFTGTGTTSATKNGVSLPCKAHFEGNVDNNGIGHVTDGSFTDNGSIGCTAVKLVNLPWTSRAVSATKANILRVTFSSPIGDCGPGTLPVTLKNGVIRFTTVPLRGGCTVSGAIRTTPKLSIVK